MLQSTLIVGTTGSGKTYLEGMVIRRLLAGGDAELALIDPKRFELWEWANDPACIAYGDSPIGYYDAVVRTYDAMQRRFDEMKRRRIRDWDGKSMYLFIDEAAVLMADKKHRNGYTEMLSAIACQGRAEHVFVVWCTQVPTKEGVPNLIRENFDYRVVLRLPDQSRTRYVLGCGERYDRLPKHGTCYVSTPDTIEGPRRQAVDDTLLRMLGL